MHRYGETQLMQVLQQQWIQDKQKVLTDKNGEKPKVLKMKTNDLYQRVIGTTIAQLAQEDKYAQVCTGNC